MSQTIDLQQLSGKWYVNQSNFPMWTKGKKQNPTFNYSLVLKKNENVLRDEVQYLKNTKSKSIVGFDYPKNTANTEFIWRGKGVLAILKSKWEIIAFNSEEEWMIIHFKKTLFTPEGYDVVSRCKTLTQVQEENIKAKLDELGVKEILIPIKQE